MKILILTMLFACGDSEPSQNQPAPETDKTSGSHAEHASQPKGGAHVGVVPEGAKVFFVEPADGATVTSPFTVKMGVEGMVVKPAGAVEDGSGHHHIIIDSDPIPNGMIVPADEQHKHFGKGQTETELTLAPGEYNIQLQFANGVHLSYGKNLNTDITIFVSDGSDTENAEPSTKSGTTEKTKAPPAPAKSTTPQKNNKAAE